MPMNAFGHPFIAVRSLRQAVFLLVLLALGFAASAKAETEAAIMKNHGLFDWSPPPLAKDWQRAELPDSDSESIFISEQPAFSMAGNDISSYTQPKFDALSSASLSADDASVETQPPLEQLLPPDLRRVVFMDSALARVPEPGNLILAALAGAWIGVRRRRRC